MMNKRNTTSYIGITHDLGKRVLQHKEKPVEGFMERYNINKLIYYEIFKDVYNAILTNDKNGYFFGK